jgi:hypothetical protein
MGKKLELTLIKYEDLNGRQQENYNFQKLSSVLADYGFTPIRLSDDWQGADFIACHIDGKGFLKVQLKGVLTVDTKYKGKDIWIAFRRSGQWYLYPHDEFLKWALAETTISRTKGWEFPNDWERIKGKYTWPSPSRKILKWLDDHAVVTAPNATAA